MFACWKFDDEYAIWEKRSFFRPFPLKGTAGIGRDQRRR